MRAPDAKVQGRVCKNINNLALVCRILKTTTLYYTSENTFTCSVRFCDEVGEFFTMFIQTQQVVLILTWIFTPISEMYNKITGGLQLYGTGKNSTEFNKLIYNKYLFNQNVDFLFENIFYKNVTNQY